MRKYRQLVESLFRLYGDNKVGKAKIVSLSENGTITKEEMAYILSANPK